MARFKEGPGFVNVCAPGKPMENVKGYIVIYPGAGKTCFMPTEGELRGYLIMLDDAQVAHVRKTGKDVDEVKVR